MNTGEVDSDAWVLSEVSMAVFRLILQIKFSLQVLEAMREMCKVKKTDLYVA